MEHFSGCCQVNPDQDRCREDPGRLAEERPREGRQGGDCDDAGSRFRAWTSDGILARKMCLKQRLRLQRRTKLMTCDVCNSHRVDWRMHRSNEG